MKKYLGIVFIFLIVVVLLKFFIADYKVEYKLDNHEVVVKYKNSRYYIEIDSKYNFDLYQKRSLKKLKIEKIAVIDDNELYCLIPTIKGNNYPICYLDDEYIDYHLIDNENLNKYKKEIKSELNGNFSYNNNLNKDEYVFLWNYKGFYKMHEAKTETFNIFEKDRYDNSLMYQIDDKLLFPNYEEEYNFKSFYLFDLINDKKQIIESKYEFSYDGYIVGNIKNKVYFYDNKNSNLYEINIKKLEIKLIGSEKLGYTKYDNNKLVSAKKSEYKNSEIYYGNDIVSNYHYLVDNNNLYKTIKENKKLKMKIFEGNKIKLIKEYNDYLYFLSEDILYKYDPIDGNIKIFNYFELKFNVNDIIYIYNE